IADRNARKLRRQMEDLRSDPQKQVALLNLRGVSALNRNDLAEARRDFEQAYRRDPNDAFTINNMGYLAELEGDRETAEFYYAKARGAAHSSATVYTATRRDAEGRKVADVSQENDNKVDAAMEASIEARRHSAAPSTPELKRRTNAPAAPPQQQPPPE